MMSPDSRHGLEFPTLKRAAEKQDQARKAAARQTSPLGKFSCVAGWVCGVWWLVAPLVSAFDAIPQREPVWSSGPAICALLWWVIYSLEGLKQRRVAPPDAGQEPQAAKQDRPVGG